MVIVVFISMTLFNSWDSTMLGRPNLSSVTSRNIKASDLKQVNCLSMESINALILRQLCKQMYLFAWQGPTLNCLSSDVDLPRISSSFTHK